MSKQPCKPSDEQLVLSARSGDTEQLAQLIVRFLPDIRAKASRYTPVGLEQEDLIQDVLIVLLQAVKGFDRTRKLPLQHLLPAVSSFGFWEPSAFFWSKNICRSIIICRLIPHRYSPSCPTAMGTLWKPTSSRRRNSCAGRKSRPFCLD